MWAFPLAKQHTRPHLHTNDPTGCKGVSSLKELQEKVWNTRSASASKNIIMVTETEFFLFDLGNLAASMNGLGLDLPLNYTHPILLHWTPWQNKATFSRVWKASPPGMSIMYPYASTAP